MTKLKTINKNEDRISKQEFLKFPVGEAENKVLDFFKGNPNSAFKFSLICKTIGLKKSVVYVALNHLTRIELIEKRGEYLCLKKKEQGK